jgi:uncharacterized protein (DUF1697 family)
LERCRIFEASQTPVTFIALLRAVNVTGYNALTMVALKKFAADLGLKNVRTVLQSGNLVFDVSAGRSSDRLERQLEEEAALQLGITTDFFVRSRDEWGAMIETNPFQAEAKDDPAHLVVMLLKHEATAASEHAVRSAIKGSERIARGAKLLYAVYPDGIGRSKLTNAVMEKRLGTRGTARNWNTVLRLQKCANP